MINAYINLFEYLEFGGGKYSLYSIIPSKKNNTQILFILSL